MKKFVTLSIILIGFFSLSSCTWNQKKAQVAEETVISPEREFFYEFCDENPSVWLEYNLPVSEPGMIYSFDYQTRRTSKGLMESFTTITRKETYDPMLANLEKVTYHFIDHKLFCLEGRVYDADNEGIFYVKKRDMIFEQDAKGNNLEKFFKADSYDTWVGRVIKGIENGSASVIPSQEEDDEYNSTFNQKILTALQKSEGIVQI